MRRIESSEGDSLRFFCPSSFFRVLLIVFLSFCLLHRLVSNSFSRQHLVFWKVESLQGNNAHFLRIFFTLLFVFIVVGTTSSRIECGEVTSLDLFS